jgi:GTP-binding protein EngB required for normal cell division
MNINTNFETEEISLKINSIVAELSKLLLEVDIEEFDRVQKGLVEDIKEHQERAALTVAFVGQYNAGKSTTISALTGRRDIRIDSDVATNETSIYKWNGIEVIDTPGLFADRADHDEITYKAIERADLLVFCLTYMLFDSITANNFKKLAYERGYRWKMMLLVNKMSDEAGDELQKIASYKESLALALQPNSLDEIPLSFIDAKDYCEGCDSDDELLQEISYFPDFIATLNGLIRDKGILAKLDTPIRICLGYVDEAKSITRRDKIKDDTFFELLNRLKRRADKSKSHLSNLVGEVSIDTYRKVIAEGDYLADYIGKEKNLESKIEIHIHNTRQVIRSAERLIQDKIEGERRLMQDELDKLSNSDLFLAFQSRLEAAENGKVPLPDFERERLREQVESFRDLSAVAQGLTAVGVGIGAMDLLGLEGLLGFGAAEVFFNFLGPVVAIAGVCMNIYQKSQQKDNDDKIIAARSNIQSKFTDVAREIESKLKQNLNKVEHNFYDKIYVLVAGARQKEEEIIATSSETMKKLLAIEKKLEVIRRELTRKIG